MDNDLVAVVLYGSGAGANFVPDLSDINVAIVVHELRFDLLQKLQPHLTVWRKQGFALPLLMDREFLQRARDVFPMEFHDIQEQHQLLWGENVFQHLVIDPRHLRFQAEHEARSKLLRLRGLYLDCAGDVPRLHALMLDSSKTFLIIMRHLLRLQGQVGALSYEEALTRFERHFQRTFPRIRELVTIRTGRQPWSSEPLVDFFRDYLAEVQQLVAVIDHLPINPTSAHA
jgi:hypothetical protein